MNFARIHPFPVCVYCKNLGIESSHLMREPNNKTILCPVLRAKMELSEKKKEKDKDNNFYNNWNENIEWKNIVLPKTPEPPLLKNPGRPARKTKSKSSSLSPIIIPRILFPEISDLSQGSPVLQKKVSKKKKKSKQTIPLTDPSATVIEVVSARNISTTPWTDDYVSDEDTPKEYTF